MPKIFVEEPFCVSENFCYRKMLGIREGSGITIIRLSLSAGSFLPKPQNRQTFSCLFVRCVSSAKLEGKEDGRLAPAYFWANYKHFDQFLQTVKNKTTVLSSVVKEFSQTSIPPLISVLYAKGYHNFR